MKTEPRLFAGRYEILEEIAGGSSIVFKAHDPHVGRLVAIKTPSDVVAATPALLDRFVEEARLLGRLNHPGILRILHFYEKGEADDRCHLVSEWRDMNLAALTTNPKVDQQARLRIFRRVLDAIEYLHSQGIVHGDIKPANILLSNDLTEVQVADLGIASARGAASHTMRATFRYVAPESLGSGRTADPQLDIYSLGMTFFEVFGGEVGIDAAFGEIFRDGHGGDGDVRWLNWHMDTSRKLPELQTLDPEIPGLLSSVIARMAEKNPALRFKAIAEIKAALSPLGEGTLAADDALQALDVEDFAKPKKKAGLSKRAVIALSVVGFLVLAIGILIIPELFAPTSDGDSGGRQRLEAAVRSAQDVGMAPNVKELTEGQQLLGDQSATEFDTAATALESAIPTAPRIAEVGSTPDQIAEALDQCSTRGGACQAEEFSDETRRSVRLSPYELSSTEATTGEFEKFATETKFVTDAERSGFLARWEGDRSVKVPKTSWKTLAAADPQADRDTLPVRGVSLNDAEAFCKWAGMRLPTEDEWEYAAQRTSEDVAPVDGWQAALLPASQAPTSGRFGMRGLQGNAWEWTRPTADPSGPAVLKGGSYLERDAARRRPAARRLQETSVAHTDDGFRCAKEVTRWPSSAPTPEKTEETPQ